MVFFRTGVILQFVPQQEKSNPLLRNFFLRIKQLVRESQYHCEMNACPIKMNGICFLVAILFCCCSCHEESPYFLPEIIDYPHIGQSDPVFKHADSLRYSLNYPAAAKAYEALLRGPIEKAGRLYALQQLAGCHLMLNQDSLARYFLDKALGEFPDTLSMPAPALADWSFDQALLAYHDFLPGKAVWYFKKAARVYQKCYP